MGVRVRVRIRVRVYLEGRGGVGGARGAEVAEREELIFRAASETARARIDRLESPRRSARRRSREREGRT